MSDPIEGPRSPVREPEPGLEPEPQLERTDSASRTPLRSRPNAGSVIGGILAGLEVVVTGRPTPPARIERTYRDAWASLDGVTVDGLDEDIVRPEPPDRSGARL